MFRDKTSSWANFRLDTDRRLEQEFLPLPYKPLSPKCPERAVHYYPFLFLDLLQPQISQSRVLLNHLRSYPKQVLPRRQTSQIKQKLTRPTLQPNQQRRPKCA